MTDAAIAEHAAALAQTDDLDWEVEPTQELLRRLRGLAVEAKATSRAMFSWCSV